MAYLETLSNFKAKVLHNIPELQDVSPKNFRHMCASATVVDCEHGDVVVQQVCNRRRFHGDDRPRVYVDQMRYRVNRKLRVHVVLQGEVSDSIFFIASGVYRVMKELMVPVEKKSYTIESVPPPVEPSSPRLAAMGDTSDAGGAILPKSFSTSNVTSSNEHCSGEMPSPSSKTFHLHHSRHDLESGSRKTAPSPNLGSAPRASPRQPTTSCVSPSAVSPRTPRTLSNISRLGGIDSTSTPDKTLELRGSPRLSCSPTSTGRDSSSLSSRGSPRYRVGLPGATKERGQDHSAHAASMRGVVRFVPQCEMKPVFLDVTKLSMPISRYPVESHLPVSLLQFSMSACTESHMYFGDLALLGNGVVRPRPLDRDTIFL